MARSEKRTAASATATPVKDTVSKEKVEDAKKANADVKNVAAELTKDIAKDSSAVMEKVVFQVGSSMVTWQRQAGKKMMATITVQKGDETPVDGFEMGKGKDQTLANVAFYCITQDKVFLKARGKEASHLSRTMEGDKKYLTDHHGGMPAEIEGHEFAASDKKIGWEKQLDKAGVKIIEDTRIKKESKSSATASAEVAIALPDSFTL